MKTAIVCDWLVTLGGAEKVIAEMIHCFPEADLFAVVDFLSAHERTIFANKVSTTTFIQKLPFARKKYRSYLPLMPLAIEQLDLSRYDVILSSSHAIAKGVITGPDQVHISYVHSPMRYAWDLQHQYLRESGLEHKFFKGWLARYYLHKMRLWDLRTATNVDYFIANSQFVARRVQKIYRRDATVIHPGIDTHKFVPHMGEKEDYYFTASRLVPYKKIDLIVDSFRAMPEKELVVIGTGPDYKKLLRKASPNIRFLGYQPDDVLIHYLQRARAFVFAAEEDFGLLPLEAQSCGVPVIAYGKGGALETVISDTSAPTGVFFDEQTPRSLIAAVKEFEKNYVSFTPQTCIDHAANFSLEVFRNKFKEFVTTVVA